MHVRPDRLLTALTIILLSGAWAEAVAEEAQTAEHPLVGKTVTVNFQSGRVMKDVVVEEVIPGDIADTIARLRIHDPSSGSRPMLGAATIKNVSTGAGEPLLVFEEKSRCLAPPDEEKLAEIRRSASASRGASAARARGSTSSTRKTRPDRTRKSPAELEAERRKQNEEKRKEFHEKTGVWLWPELTDEQQAEALAKVRENLKTVSEKFAPLNMQLYETKYYLFLSDIPPQMVTLFTSSLDKMHEHLCKAFGVKNKEGVWLGGKAPVIAFVNSQHFVEFERMFFNINTPPTAQGLAHQLPTGEVIISCHCGNDPHYFAGVIVHEATHGFVHRYKSPEIIPNWLNEGIAEWVSMSVVTTNKGVQRKVKASIEQMQQTGTLGPEFFTARNIAANQYGTAAAMVDFMLRSNPKAFRAMIDEIKSGVKWEDALQKTFKVTPEELVQKFGAGVVGIPILRP